MIQGHIFLQAILGYARQGEGCPKDFKKIKAQTITLENDYKKRSTELENNLKQRRLKLERDLKQAKQELKDLWSTLEDPEKCGELIAGL